MQIYIYLNYIQINFEDEQMVLNFDFLNQRIYINSRKSILSIQ